MTWQSGRRPGPCSRGTAKGPHGSEAWATLCQDSCPLLLEFLTRMALQMTCYRLTRSVVEWGSLYRGSLRLVRKGPCSRLYCQCGLQLETDPGPCISAQGTEIRASPYSNQIGRYHRPWKEAAGGKAKTGGGSPHMAILARPAAHLRASACSLLDFFPIPVLNLSFFKKKNLYFPLSCNLLAIVFLSIKKKKNY